MEDIEDMVGDFAGAPRGLHLPKTEASPPRRSSASNAVGIKPRRSRVNSGATRSDVSTCVDGETTAKGSEATATAKVPGTEVRARFSNFPISAIVFLGFWWFFLVQFSSGGLFFVLV